MSAGFEVRPPESDAEFDAYWRLRVLGEDAEQIRGWQRRYVETRPGAEPHERRAAFEGGALVGCYEVERRVLCAGPARLPTGCIGNVVTHPDHRRRGVASAMMADALAYAHEQRLALLLLDGIADFYHRFGYADVFDWVEHRVDPAQALALETNGLDVRVATADDAPALLDHYHRFHAPYVGRFERTLELERHRLALHDAPMRPRVAVDADGRVRGYRLPRWRQPAVGSEVAAADAPAALALLRQHATECDGLEAPGGLRWCIPLGSWLYYACAEHVGTLETRVWRQRRGDWMARSGHVPTLAEALRPLFAGRAPSPAGLEPDGTLVLDGHAIKLEDASLVQLLFGYRPAWWVAKRDRLPPALVPTLDALFPHGVGYIAGGDYF
jgi:GNAT superfamily N-acetyltransferase